jgi:hypothetical protein
MNKIVLGGSHRNIEVLCIVLFYLKLMIGGGASVHQKKVGPLWEMFSEIGESI